MQLLSQTTLRQIQAGDPKRKNERWWYVETTKQMYEATTLRESLLLFASHATQDQSECLRVGSVG